MRVALGMTSLAVLLAIGCSAGSDPQPLGGAAGTGSAGAAAAMAGQTGQSGQGGAASGGSAGHGGDSGNAGNSGSGGAGAPNDVDASAQAGAAGSSGGADAQPTVADAAPLRDAAAPPGDARVGEAGARDDAALGDPAARAAVIAAMRKANDYFMAKWPDPSLDIVTDKARPSNIWTRGVYYEGLMALYGVDVEQRAKYETYAVTWAQSHSWGLNSGSTTRSADNQCAGQTYIDLYNIKNDAVRIRDIKTSVDAMVASTVVNDWYWIDALQMAMPVFARLGVVYSKTAYFDRMYAMYNSTKTTQGLYNATDRLWWRDKSFLPPYVEPNGDDCYWSRGNGWVFAALARVLDILPASDTHRSEYLADFAAMAGALKPLQRSDGFWNVSLHDPTHFAGKELTGTALFAYGMAWGVRKGLLSAADYSPVVDRAWNAMITDSLHPNGFLGWVQGSGKEPADGQPLSYDKVPDFEDYGLGCFLLAGSEVAQAR